MKKREESNIKVCIDDNICMQLISCLGHPNDIVVPQGHSFGGRVSTVLRLMRKVTTNPLTYLYLLHLPRNTKMKMRSFRRVTKFIVFALLASLCSRILELLLFYCWFIHIFSPSHLEFVFRQL